MEQTKGEVGIPTSLDFHSSRSAIKVKSDPSRRAINVHVGALGRGNVRGSPTGEIREGRVLSPEMENTPCGGGRCGSMEIYRLLQMIPCDVTSYREEYKYRRVRTRNNNIFGVRAFLESLFGVLSAVRAGKLIDAKRH
ncbi:hypothetical protein AVEN_233636-1 [Araneus ventricosus]|uniref:Uncharacterized protein n=1 Tax=Araneus ventricosus TaxID=182803 RepID=A0A4Y2VRF7_ARAVE|nr:hypothetical protein AVEN_233636-1 [Araneus ventricosus]